MNADGSRKRLLMRDAGLHGSSGWSPDGRKILFGRWRDGNDDIYVMNSDGSGQRNLTRTRNTLNQGAVWSPDGRKIAFMSNRDGTWAFYIYVMNADGSGKRRLTPNPADLPYLVARRAEDRDRWRRRIRTRHYPGHERRREQKAAPDAQRLGCCLVARRAEDRLHGRRPQRLGHLRHEPRRERAAEPHAEAGSLRG